MSEKQIRKFLFAFIAAVLTVSVILTFYPADLIRAPFIDLVNAVRADGEEDGEAEVTCQFCGKSYHFDKPHLEALRMKCITRKMN